MNRSRDFVQLGLLGLIALAVFVGRADTSELETRLAALSRAHKGKTAIAVRQLKGGEQVFLNSDEVLPTASLIKLPVMVEVYAQAAERKLSLDDMLTLTKDEMVPGSGILTEHFSPGARFSVRDATRLMIAFSDNTATNLVLERLGVSSTNLRMESLGLHETRVNAKVFKGSTTSVDPERTKKYGLGSTTAREMVELLTLLHEGKLVSPEAGKEMLAHLKKCDDKDKFPRLLPPGVVVAHKSGSISDARTDAGILYLKTGPVAVCVMTNGNEDKSWKPENAGNRFCAEVARTVHDYFVAKDADGRGERKPSP